MILVDTHVLIWSQLNERKLTRTAFSTLRRARISRSLAISAITLIEIANMIEWGKLAIEGTVTRTIEQLSAEIFVLPITPEIAALSIQFPLDFPRDPMDRIIAATARAEGIPLVTADERIQACPLVKTIW
ncbi:MAG TPA: type II toxin-antitoxin system VapC family toxin [Terriglobales bacterium]